MNMKKIGFSLFLLLLLILPCVHGRITAYQDITIISYDDCINVPINITTAYIIQTADPVTGIITILYPNKVISIPDGNEVTTGYTRINASENTFSFLLITNLTKNTVHNFRIIFDNTLMRNATPSYNTSIGFMKSHVINPAPGAGTGYQVRIKVNYGSGTDSGENVYLNGKCRSDFADIRFLAADKVTQLSYWIEYKENGNYAIFWVKVDDDLSSDPATIYIYYGDQSLTETTSNGTATFLAFDDFNDGNYNGWIVVGGTWSVTNGYLSGYASGYQGIAYPYSHSNIRIGVKIYPYADYNHGVSFRASDPNNLYLYTNYIPGQYMDMWKKVSGSYTHITGPSSTSMSRTCWQNIYITAYGNEIKFYLNGTLQLVGTDSTFSSGNYIYLGAVTSYAYFDDFFLAKYVSPEPSHGEWGSEFLTANFSVTYGQIITESGLTVKIPRMTFQEIAVNASLSWVAPENANDVMKLIAESEWGRYALVVLPLFVMLVASSRHTAGVAGGVATGLCMGVNYMIGAELYSTLILSWIGAVCLLLIIYEARRN